MDQVFFKVDPKFGKDEFLRKAWISLAKEDAPIEIFDSNFTDVTEEQYRILSAHAAYQTSWEGLIGNDRTESYIDVETYYEQIPYTDYEKKYDSNIKDYRQVPVTKYRKEERQRQVRKNRTVTDWTNGNGHHSGKAGCLDCLDPKGTYDASRFLNDFDAYECSALSEEERAAQPDMQITQSVMDFARNKHEADIESNLRQSLPGDHAKDITYQVLSYTPTDATMIKVTEYQATIDYKGQTYEKRAFSLGKMTVSSTDIPNPLSIEDAKKEMRAKTKRENAERTAAIEGKVWESTGMLSVISILLLAASCVVSALLRFLIPVIACFAVALGMFIFSKIFAKVKRNSIKEKTERENTAATAACSAACADYEKNQREKILEALNKKLTSLGLSPATEQEMLG